MSIQHFHAEVAASATVAQSQQAPTVLRLTRADTCPHRGGHSRVNLDCRYFFDERAACGAIWPDVCRADGGLPLSTADIRHILNRPPATG